MTLAFMLVDRLYEISNRAISVGSAIGIARGLGFLRRFKFMLPSADYG